MVKDIPWKWWPKQSRRGYYTYPRQMWLLAKNGTKNVLCNYNHVNSLGRYNNCNYLYTSNIRSSKYVKQTLTDVKGEI